MRDVRRLLSMSPSSRLGPIGSAYGALETNETMRPIMTERDHTEKRSRKARLSGYLTEAAILAAGLALALPLILPFG